MILRPYQETSADWLTGMPNALLLDEPRVGKTAPSLVAAARMGAKKIAVLGPAIAREHWRRQHAEWAPGTELMVDSVNRIATSRSRADEFRRWRPDVLILDEAQLLRSVDAKRTIAVYGRKFDKQGGIAGAAGVVWGLSGTLAPNHIGETWTHLHAMGQTDMSAVAFLYHFCQVIETQYGPMAREPREENIEEFKALLRPISMRRRRRDIWPDLPLAAWNTIPMVMSDPLRREVARIERELATEAVRRQLVGATPEEAAKIIEDAEPHMAAFRAALARLKAPLIEEQIKDLLDSGVQKLVVLAWHKEMIDGLHARLRPYAPAKIYGATSDRDRWFEIDRFQNNPACRVMIGNIETMGTCIALNAANHAMFAEYHWNLGSVIQAALRIIDVNRQERPEIMVPMLAGTIDEAVASTLAWKAEHATILNEL